MSLSFSLEGKTAIVTGADGLLGRAICETYIEYGANLVMLDQKEYSTSNINDKSIYIKCDITNKEKIEKLILKLKKLKEIKEISYQLI